MSNNLSKTIRKDILNISCNAKVGHIGSAFSIVEILLALYTEVLEINNKKTKQQNKFILSKGHAAPALYAVLYRMGIINNKIFNSYCKNGGFLEEHPTHSIPGIEISTGSLGHGLSIGLGMALSKRLKKSINNVFVLASDAECDEGETWEAALSAAHFKVNNLCLLIDYNKVQALGSIEEVLSLEPLNKKWKAFNWHVQEVDGHDIQQIVHACQNLHHEKPSVIICHTIRGFGVSFMQHKIDWHYITPTEIELQNALKELDLL